MPPRRKNVSTASGAANSNLHEFLKSHPVIIFLGAIVAGFVAGWTANREFLVGDGKQIVPREARFLGIGEKSTLISSKTDDELAYSLFGAGRNVTNRATMMIDQDENRRLLAMEIRNAKRSIQIVTLDGSSWIPTHIKTIEDKMKNVEVELLMLDYRDPKLHEFVQRAMDAAGHDRKELRHYAQQLGNYTSFLSISNKFSIGLYNWYPWCRFTLFDGEAVSFILTPAIVGGQQAQPFFTRDPGLAECFSNLFQQVRSSSKIFRTAQAVSDYRNGTFTSSTLTNTFTPSP